MFGQKSYTEEKIVLSKEDKQFYEQRKKECNIVTSFMNKPKQQNKRFTRRSR
jgi:hypothetical protein